MAAIYIVLVLLITLLVKILENMFARSDRARNGKEKSKKTVKEVA